MDIGETVNDDQPIPPLAMGTDHIGEQWNGVEVSLWKRDTPKQELFPPSTGTIKRIESKIVIQKPRSVREEVKAVAGAYPMFITADVPRLKEGTQWCSFKLDAIESIGLTILLRSKLQINDSSGSYEVILGRGASEFLYSMKKYLGDR